jgi:hypothetical protein
MSNFERQTCGLHGVATFEESRRQGKLARSSVEPPRAERDPGFHMRPRAFQYLSPILVAQNVFLRALYLLVRLSRSRKVGPIR